VVDWCIYGRVTSFIEGERSKYLGIGEYTNSACVFVYCICWFIPSQHKCYCIHKKTLIVSVILFVWFKWIFLIKIVINLWDHTSISPLLIVCFCWLLY